MLGSSGLADLHKERSHQLNKEALVGTKWGNQTGPGCQAVFGLPSSLLRFCGPCGVATPSQEHGTDGVTSLIFSAK